MSLAIIILCLVSAALAFGMLMSQSPLTMALSLLGVLVCTAGIYGLQGQHFVATIQLVVYAGAIMVLFIFSIMLLNLEQKNKTKIHPSIKIIGGILGGLIFLALADAIRVHFADDFFITSNLGSFSTEMTAMLGGNTKVLSHALFSQYYLSFEAISLALLVAIIGAVVLAKRKFD